MSKLFVDIELAKKDFKLKLKQEFPLQGITAIWGASGSGKSLILRCLAGFEPATGSITLDKAKLLCSKEKLCLAPYSRPIGYVSQTPNLFSHLSVKENLLFAYKRAEVDWKCACYSYDEIVELLKLKPLLERSTQTLSGGEKQRVAIAQALLRYPKVLLLDEPLAAVDGISKEAILELLEQIKLQLKIPIFYVTHSYPELLRLADQVLLFNKGRAVGFSPVNDICYGSNFEYIPLDEACSMLEGQLQTNIDEHGLARFDFSDGKIFVPSFKSKNSSQESTHSRVVIYSKDVSINLEKHSSSSILNILPAIIVSCDKLDNTSVLLKLDLGHSQLSSIITQKSYQLLGLKPAMPVFAQIKTVSLLRH